MRSELQRLEEKDAERDAKWGEWKFNALMKGGMEVDAAFDAVNSELESSAREARRCAEECRFAKAEEDWDRQNEEALRQAQNQKEDA